MLLIGVCVGGWYLHFSLSLTVVLRGLYSSPQRKLDNAWSNCQCNGTCCKGRATDTPIEFEIQVPIICKMRILKSLEDTIELAQLLENSGASALVVHGRQCIIEKSEKRRRKYVSDGHNVSS